MSLTIDQDLLHPVIAWATKHKAAFLPNFYGRAYFPFDKGRLPHFMQEIKDKVEEHYGIAKMRSKSRSTRTLLALSQTADKCMSIETITTGD